MRSVSSAAKVRSLRSIGPGGFHIYSPGPSSHSFSPKLMKTGLRKRGTVEATGETENCTERVRLSVPTSLSLCRDEDGDDNASLAGVAINERGETELLSVGDAPTLGEAGAVLYIEK